MSPAIIVIVFVAGVLVHVGARASKLARELKTTALQRELLENEARALTAGLACSEEKNAQKIGWLDNQEQEITWLRAELEKRPKITRKTYKILTLGMKATGKTSLTLKWANPLTDLGTLEGTKIERYERTVSHVKQNDLVTEHVFEVHDWGGEHLVDAQHELIVEEIHGLLIVVDLASKDAKQVEPARIHDQHQEFLPQVLKYIFGPKTVALCKTVVLFINKSDLLSGTPAQVEEQARKLYAPLVENLNKYKAQLDVRVLVGSASYGHSTHLLFSHFVEQILPRSAYDNQLLQRMKSDCATIQVMPQAASESLEPEEQTIPVTSGPSWVSADHSVQLMNGKR